MKTLWHSTRLNLLSKILKEGLIAKVPENRSEKRKGVYLSTYMFNWTYYASLMGHSPALILKIDVSKLKLIPDYHSKEDLKFIKDKIIGTDYISLTDIEPMRIIELWEEFEQNSFRIIPNKNSR